MLARSWKPAAAAGGIAITWSAPAPIPAAAGPDLRAAFSHFDADGDGAITDAEFRSAHAKDKLIINSDKPIALAEPLMIPVHRDKPAVGLSRTDAVAQMVAHEFAEQDADRNGAITFEEFSAFQTRMMDAAFRNIDRNRDGALEAAELTAVTERLPKVGRAVSFAELDKNHDGRVGPDEFFADRN
jgi:Ca2+-binding EF-hand superfamily protein